MLSRQEKGPLRPSLFERVVSVILLLIILLLAQPFFTKMLENFERTSVQQIVRQLRAAAHFKMAEYVALDKVQQLPEQLNVNPITWLGIDDLGGWDRYQGEVDRLDFEKMQEQSWVYDRSLGRLIYKVKYPYLMKNEDPISNRIQFRLVMDYTDTNNDGRFTEETDSINAVQLLPVYDYRWLVAEDE